MSADVMPLRPRAAGDAERLWDEMKAAEHALEAEAAEGAMRVETICRLADAYRAWCRAAAWDRIA